MDSIPVIKSQVSNLTIRRIFLLVSLSIVAAISLYRVSSLSSSISTVRQEQPVHVINTDNSLKFSKPREVLSPLVVEIGTKDKLMSKLKDLNVDIGEIRKIHNLLRLRNYQKVTLTINQDLASPTHKRTVNKIYVVNDKTHRQEFIRQGNDFHRKDITLPLVKEQMLYSAKIKRNLLSTLKSFNLSSAHINELLNAYSYNIDFQRSIKLGDEITLLVEEFKTTEQQLSHRGKILFASLNTSGKNHNLYWYEYKGKGQYFTEHGKSIRRGLLRSPLDVIKISSSFGMRNSPINGFHTMHKGVDFAAPTGTPIYAAGDGVIRASGWLNGYGKYIELKHDNSTSTFYAHISKFARHITKGVKVKQGEIIAYVGATGRATGPHLHYEVRINGRHVNPMKVKTTADLVLAGSDYTKFTEFKRSISKQLALQESKFKTVALYP